MLRRLLVVLAVFSAFAFAQDAPKPQAYISEQFGPGYLYIENYPVLTGDLDGDGTEDAVFVTTYRENPLLDEETFHYAVVDPYDEYFGFGDPRVTVNFNARDPEKAKYILVVHNWRAATPKAKFVVINLPFQKLSLGRIPLKKKKVVLAIKAEDLTGTTSAIYWDGKKKYKWNSLSGID